MAKAQNYRGDTAHTFLMSGTNGVGTPHNFERKHILGGGDTAQHLQEKLSCGWAGGGWVGGGPSQEIIPLRGSILQAETCQILSLTENPRWSPSVAIMFSLTCIYPRTIYKDLQCGVVMRIKFCL